MKLGGDSFSSPLFHRLLCSSCSASSWDFTDPGIFAGGLGFDGDCRASSSSSSSRMRVSSDKPTDWSRLSPFTKTKARRKKKVEKQGSFKSDATQRKMFEKWFSLIDTANLSHKRVILPVKNLRNKFLSSSDFLGVLHGFIVFEVEWSNVRGINYLNELLTDTNIALEAKFMKRWEFDSIDQAAGCISSWFSGTYAEQQILKEHLDISVGERFFDAKEEFLGSDALDADEEPYHGDPSGDYSFPPCLNCDLDVPLACGNNQNCVLSSPPAHKRRKVTNSISTDIQVDCSLEEKQCESEGSVNDSDACSVSGSESTVDLFIYKDILIVFRFNGHDLPFKLRDIMVSDLRLLTLLEAGLPSWVIFLQSYPGFCHVYRPWMCPLARALYVTISIITVLIGFYDLYKNVPVLKATAAHLCGPLLDWIETWEMVTRIQYLGTMLFLHNLKKAVKWFLMVSHTARSFLSVIAQPLVETFDFLLPLWNICSGVVISFCSVTWVAIESLWNLIEDLAEILLQPLWFLISAIWTIGTLILLPVFGLLWEVIYLPIRLIIALADGLEDVFTFLFTSLCGSLISLWQTLSGVFRVASASSSAASAYEVSKWRVLWNDLFSHVFRAIRSILNGFVAFFMACNRHRLSIYHHIQVFIQRLMGQTPQINSARQSPCRTPSRSSPSSPRERPKATRSSTRRTEGDVSPISIEADTS